MPELGAAAGCNFIDVANAWHHRGSTQEQGQRGKMCECTRHLRKDQSNILWQGKPSRERGVRVYIVDLSGIWALPAGRETAPKSRDRVKLTSPRPFLMAPSRLSSHHHRTEASQGVRGNCARLIRTVEDRTTVDSPRARGRETTDSLRVEKHNESIMPDPSLYTGRRTFPDAGPPEIEGPGALVSTLLHH